MRLFSRYRTEIISGIITGIITLMFLLIVKYFTNDRFREAIKTGNFNWSRDITLKDLTPDLTPYINPKETPVRGITVIDSSETDFNDKVQVNYYIIIGSFRNLLQAQQKTEKLKNDFNTNIILLSPTKDGYYRISYGQYSTFEKAKASIISIRKTINSDAWILSVKE